MVNILELLYIHRQHKKSVQQNLYDLTTNETQNTNRFLLIDKDYINLSYLRIMEYS